MAEALGIRFFDAGRAEIVEAGGLLRLAAIDMSHRDPRLEPFASRPSWIRRTSCWVRAASPAPKVPSMAHHPRKCFAWNAALPGSQGSCASILVSTSPPFPAPAPPADSQPAWPRSPAPWSFPGPISSTSARPFRRHSPLPTWLSSPTRRPHASLATRRLRPPRRPQRPRLRLAGAQAAALGLPVIALPLEQLLNGIEPASLEERRRPVIPARLPGRLVRAGAPSRQPLHASRRRCIATGNRRLASPGESSWTAPGPGEADQARHVPLVPPRRGRAGAPPAR